MHVLVPHDYQDAVRQLACVERMAAHDVEVLTGSEDDHDSLAASRPRWPMPRCWC